MTRSSTGARRLVGAGPRGRTRPSPITRTRSARPSTSCDLAGHDDDGDALVGEPADEGVDLGAGADVDAAGGLVEQQDPAAVQQPAGEDDLLLVAAGQGARLAVHAGGADVEDSTCSVAARRSAPRSRKPPRANRREGGERDVAWRLTVTEQQSLALALLGGQPDARPTTAASTDPVRSGSPSTVDGAAVALARAEDGLEDLRAPGADEPGEADDLAGAAPEARRRENSPAPREALDAQQRLGVAATFRRGGKTYSIVRPVISRMSSAVGVSLAGRPVATVRPSLSTVTRSPISRISSSRCEM